MSTYKLRSLIALIVLTACEIKQPASLNPTEPVAEVVKDQEPQPEASSQASEATTTTAQAAKLNIDGYQYLSSHLYIYRHASNDTNLYGPNRTNDQLCLHNEFNGQVSDFCWVIRTSPGSATWGNFQASGPSSWTHTVNTFDGDTNISVTLNGLWEIQ